jgi:hypothetical protein
MPREALRSPAVWVVLLAAAGTFAPKMGARRSMGLFIGASNTATGLGIASIGPAFVIGVLAAGGAGMAAPSVLMSATTRLGPAAAIARCLVGGDDRLAQHRR